MVLLNVLDYQVDELTDKELKLLINHIDNSISKDVNIVEKDRWTIWKAVK